MDACEVISAAQARRFLQDVLLGYRRPGTKSRRLQRRDRRIEEMIISEALYPEIINDLPNFIHGSTWRSRVYKTCYLSRADVVETRSEERHHTYLGILPSKTARVASTSRCWLLESSTFSTTKVQQLARPTGLKSTAPKKGGVPFITQQKMTTTSPLKRQDHGRSSSSLSSALRKATR